MAISEATKDIGFDPYCVQYLTNGHIAVGGWDRGARVGRLATLDADLNVVWQNTIESRATSMLELLGRLLIGMWDGMRMPLLL